MDDFHAKKKDAEDPLKSFRKKFHIPKDSIYLCGNSLGLQPKTVEGAILEELKDWKELGVEGHFHAKNPWLPYHEALSKPLSHLLGAKPWEVVAMNSLTVNLHLMMISFYKPTPKRHKILIEAGAFPSDLYAVSSQIQIHGRRVEESLIQLQPRKHEFTLRAEDIKDVIEKEGQSVALILLGGVNYYTGQSFDLKQITEWGHQKGCIVGFDLAHAAGNVPLSLHDGNVDFACWCSYKYLNSGPGSVAGCFVHERHGKNPNIPRLAGWWGHDKDTRFKTDSPFKPISGAEGWQLSNPPILSLCAVKASLDIFDDVGMETLRTKSLLLTGFLEDLLNDHLNDQKSDKFSIITPKNPFERGCQLSILVPHDGRKVFRHLTKKKVICDWREPNCIRVAPVPLYNSFFDVFQFVQIFKEAL